MRSNTIIIKLGPMRVGVLSRAEPVVEMTGHRSVYRLPRLLTVKLRKIIKLERGLAEERDETETYSP